MVATVVVVVVVMVVVGMVVVVIIKDMEVEDTTTVDTVCEITCLNLQASDGIQEVIQEDTKIRLSPVTVPRLFCTCIM